MKMGSVKYLVKEGLKGAWANRLMTLASVGVLVACMVVIGLAILISENVTLAIGKLEKQNVVMVYMKDYNWALYSDSLELPEQPREGADQNGILESDYVIHNDDEAKSLCDKISALPNVDSVEYVSSEVGLETVKGDMMDGQQDYFTFLDDQYGNPLSAAAKVTMKEMALFDETIGKIKEFDGRCYSVSRRFSRKNRRHKAGNLCSGILDYRNSYYYFACNRFKYNTGNNV